MGKNLGMLVLLAGTCFGLIYFFYGKTNPRPGIHTVLASSVGNSNPEVVRYNREGLRLFESRQYELARDRFKSALDLSPLNTALRNNLAMTYLEIGKQQGEKLQFNEALSSFETAIGINPDISSFHVGAGWAYGKLEQDEKAISELETAVRLNAGESMAYRLLGDLYYKKDNPEKAIEALEKALALEPSDESLKQYLAKIKQDKGTESGFEKSTTAHFIIKFEGEENKEAAQKISDILEGAYRDIGSVFYEKSLRPVIVILYSDKLFQETVHSPLWVGGLYDGKIRIPLQGAAQSPDSLKRVLYHEYTHAVLFQITASPLPTWLNEGLAMYFEGSSMDPVFQKVSQARERGALIPLRNLHGSFMEMDAPTSDLAYAESKVAVQNLIDRYSVRRIRDLLDRYRGSGSFDSLFEEVFLMPYHQFDQAFLSDKK